MSSTSQKYSSIQFLPPRHTRALLDSFLTSPSLLLTTPEASPFDTSKLEFPQELPLLRASQKLGHLCEDALATLLEHTPHYDLLARNLQIQEGKHNTIGEIDYLLRDTTNCEIIHLELAIKFYLAYQRADHSWIYPGPNSRDNWQSKLAKLRSHQLGMSSHPAAQLKLQEFLQAATSLKVQHLVIGRLFYHIASDNTPPLPEYASNETPWSPWLLSQEWSAYFSSHADVRIIPKSLWGCQLDSELLASLPLVSPQQLREQAKARCIMFSPSPHFTPHFLVPDQWTSAPCFENTD